MAAMVTSSYPSEAGASSFEELEHELRTPLAAIRAFIEIMRDYPEISEAQRRSFIDALLIEEARLSQTVDRILGYKGNAPLNG